jgi:hypothetical protein
MRVPQISDTGVSCAGVVRRLGAAIALAAIMSGSATGAKQAGDAAAQANNPLANMTALNFQDYYIGRITDTDADGNQFWVRFAKPFAVAGTNWLMRASLPVNSFPVATSGDLATGIGDLNVFAAYLFDTGTPAVSFGFGPQITAPTAPDERLGSEKWSAGFANVLFDGRSKRFQYGYLLTWQASFAGSDDRADVNTGAFQPFAFYQLGKGLYLRSAPIWVYNFENDAYSVPLGLGIGQVIKRGKTVFNVFVPAPGVGRLPRSGPARLADLRWIQYAVSPVASNPHSSLAMPRLAEHQS